jgi:hypothetical protein
LVSFLSRPLSRFDAIAARINVWLKSQIVDARAFYPPAARSRNPASALQYDVKLFDRDSLA